MPPQSDPEKLSLPRILIGLGCFLIFVAVFLGASLKGQSALPKYFAMAGLFSAVLGAIGSAFARKSRPDA
jgi:hypothetical protein